MQSTNCSLQEKKKQKQKQKQKQKHWNKKII